MHKRFCEAFDKATEGNIPVVKGNFKQKKNLFMTKDALRLRKGKKLRTTTRKLRGQFELQIITGVKTKPKPFCKYVTSRLKSQVDIPTITLNLTKKTQQLHWRKQRH